MLAEAPKADGSTGQMGPLMAAVFWEQLDRLQEGPLLIAIAPEDAHVLWRVPAEHERLARAVGPLDDRAHCVAAVPAGNRVGAEHGGSALRFHDVQEGLEAIDVHESPYAWCGR